MATILTAAEAANVLRTDVTDPAMTGILPAVDKYIETATGHDWSADNEINPLAKAAARILLVQWYDNPAAVVVGGAVTPLSAGLTAVLTQLESLVTPPAEAVE